MQCDSAGKKRISKMGDRFLALFLIWRLKREPMYGYSIANEISDIGLSPHRQSTVYLILSRLEKLGMIKGRNKQVGKRMRKMYTSTAKGTKLFEDVRKRRMKGILREFIQEMLA
ncbi:MAG: PadR family transcriptional regulator [Candidatus Micrarchaeota archaeon]|nr:PadR family transcriptional regulator [Candidatus Micrarchaeota archaeon]